MSARTSDYRDAYLARLYGFKDVTVWAARARAEDEKRDQADELARTARGILADVDMALENVEEIAARVSHSTIRYLLLGVQTKRAVEALFRAHDALEAVIARADG